LGTSFKTKVRENKSLCLFDFCVIKKRPVMDAGRFGYSADLKIFWQSKS
jgi:hypothetical protein